MDSRDDVELLGPRTTDEDIGVGNAGVLETSRHRDCGGGHVAGGHAGVDLDQLFVDVVGELLMGFEGAGGIDLRVEQAGQGGQGGQCGQGFHGANLVSGSSASQYLRIMEPNRSGLLAEYLFAGDAADTSGNGRHGAVYGAELVADRFGRPGQAYRFGGVDDYIEVAPPPPLPADAMSVSIWARYAPRDFAGYTNCLIAQDDGNDDDQSRRVFQLSTDGGHFIWHRMIGARDPMYRRVIRPGVWYHVVGVFDHGSHHLYVNRELCDSVEHRFWTHAEQPLHIGRKGTPEPYFFFKGELDDVRIYGRALGTGQIDGLWREGGWQPEPVAPVTEPDPISGHWGQDGIVFLDLRYDGAQGVSGRIMSGRPSNPGVISTGRFTREQGA